MARFVSAIAPRTASACSWHLSGGSSGSVAVAFGGKGIAVSEFGCGDTGKVNSLINRLTSFRRNYRGKLLIFSCGMNTETGQNKRGQEQQPTTQIACVPVLAPHAEQYNAQAETGPRNRHGFHEFSD
jgi:hypothetical protein